MAAAPQNALKSVRVPLIGTMQYRSGTDLNKDQHFINCFPESRKNDITEAKKVYLVQRPGLVTRTSVTAAVGRGTYFWNGKCYSVFGNKLYADAVQIHTLATSSGMCGITVGTVTARSVLAIADGDRVYVVKPDNSVVEAPISPAQWATGEAITAGNWRVPTTPNGFYYEALDGGTTGGTEPTWPTYIGETVVDNDVTWVAKGYVNSAGTWAAAHNYLVGDRVSVAAGGLNYLFEVITAGKSGSSAPAWSVETGTITTDGTVQWICSGEFRDDAPPKYNEPSIAFMDGYLFLVLKRTDGSGSADIYNCDIDNPYSWNPSNFITAEQFPDNLRALARQNNMLVALGDTSTEFFYDAGNAYGSPLARNTSYTLQVGIAAPYAIYQSEKFCMFVGQSESGGRAVWLLDGFAPKEVSDEFVEKILDAEGTNISNATGYGLRTNGHLFYIVNLTNTTLCYDLEEKMWHQWSGVNCVAMSDSESGRAILQHKTNGKLYYLDPSVGTDDGTAIQMEIYTTKYDFETMNLKSMQSFNLVSDMVGSTKTVDIRWSDDDYNTWSDWRTLNFYPRAFYVSLGSFRRRAFNIKFSGGVPARFEAIEFDLRLWKA